jgi:uncharacterized protein (TIGR00106 family)
MAIVEVSIVPLGLPTTSLSPYVARALEILQQSQLRYELTAMGTIISGDLDQIWPVLRCMHESCFEKAEVARVLTQIKVDDRRDRLASPAQKVRSVLDKLVHPEDAGGREADTVAEQLP